MTVQRKTIKNLDVKDIVVGDVITSYENDGTKGSKSHLSYLVESIKQTPKAIVIQIAGLQVAKRFAIGTTFNVSRAMTDAEVEARAAETQMFLIREAMKMMRDPESALKGATQKLIDELSKESSRPTSALQYQAANIAKAQGEAECWYDVAHRYAYFEDKFPMAIAMCKAVLGAVKSVDEEVLRFASGSSRSTSAYSNALDADETAGKVEWRRSYAVSGVRSVAKQLNINITDEEV